MSGEIQHQLDFMDGREIALMIANTYSCGWLHFGSIGATWSPRGHNGRHWTERKCRAVLDALIAFGLVTMYEGFTGNIVRLNETGYRYFNISGAPAYSDSQAERYFLPGSDD